MEDMEYNVLVSARLNARERALYYSLTTTSEEWGFSNEEDEDNKRLSEIEYFGGTKLISLREAQEKARSERSRQPHVVAPAKPRGFIQKLRCAMMRL